MTAALAATAARNLLKVSLLAKLAVDLQDPALARRAAREAQTHARLLAGLDFPPDEAAEVHCGPRLPDPDVLLVRRYPALETTEKDAL